MLSLINVVHCASSLSKDLYCFQKEYSSSWSATFWRCSDKFFFFWPLECTHKMIYSSSLMLYSLQLENSENFNWWTQSSVHSSVQLLRKSWMRAALSSSCFQSTGSCRKKKKTISSQLTARMWWKRHTKKKRFSNFARKQLVNIRLPLHRHESVKPFNVESNRNVTKNVAACRKLSPLSV